MAKPATEARLAAAAKGFTQVIGRGNAHIVTKNPTTGKCAYDGQVGGGWHYGAGLETDTALEPDTDTNYWKMVKALYNIRVRKSFSAGDLLKWTDPSTGQYVILQPNNLSWVDHVTESQQFISSPAAVTGAVNDDVALWNAAYGAGRHFRYQAGPLRLTKHLIIDAPANLPAATVANPYLEIAFVMTPSSGVSLIADGSTWDKKTKKNTANAIEFRTSGGVTFWSFAAPRAYDSAGNEVAGILQLRKQGANYIAATRFPKSWIDSVLPDNYPIMLDPTVDKTVAASADDGIWEVGGTGYDKTGASVYLTPNYGLWCRWTGITIPQYATIDVSYISLYMGIYHSGTIKADMYFDDTNTPTAPTSYSSADGKTKTTAHPTWTLPNSTGYQNSSSTNTVIQELVNSYDYSNGAMQALLLFSGAEYNSMYTYDYGSSYGPKLHIEYTEAASGDPEGSLIGGKLIRGGLLLHGVLGR